MPHVFISHANRDGEIATALARGLEQRGYTTWYYERDSVPGPTYHAQTRAGIDQCQACLVLISKISMDSVQVDKEITRALENRKKFVPVLVDCTQDEFRAHQPEWSQAIGAAVSIGLRDHGLQEVIAKLAAGLSYLGIVAETAAAETKGRTREDGRRAAPSGHLVPKFCDRRLQEDEFLPWFGGILRGERFGPGVALIQGEMGQCHSSLVDRLLYRAERHAAGCLGEQQVAFATPKPIAWRYDGNPAGRFNRLIASLFAECGVSYDRLMEPTPENLGAAIRQMPVSFVSFRHDLQVDQCDEHAPALIEQYVRFWNLYPEADSGPRVISFINVIYPKPEPSALPAWLDLRGKAAAARTGRIRKLIADLTRGHARFKLLDELTPVSRDDVFEWMNMHNLLDTEFVRLARSEAIFKDAPPPKRLRPMSEVEVQLKAIAEESPQGWFA